MHSWQLIKPITKFFRASSPRLRLCCMATALPHRALGVRIVGEIGYIRNPALGLSSKTRSI
jgi:hypothetical protein